MTKEECEIETSKAIMEMRTNVAELKKENAELKLYAKVLEEADNTNILHCMKVNGKLYKAKKLIKEMLSILPKENIEGVYEITEEAEQFLRGVVEMTDEEMAEEWLDEKYLKDMGVRKPCKEAYLAGLKAGRPQWHDLRKDPYDLPESSIFHEVLNQNGIKMYYDDILKKWNMYFNGEIVQAQTPVAWCEILKFEE